MVKRRPSTFTGLIYFPVWPLPETAMGAACNTDCAILLRSGKALHGREGRGLTWKNEFGEMVKRRLSSFSSILSLPHSSRNGDVSSGEDTPAYS